MRLLVADGGQRRDHHVEAVEPGPTFDEVKAGRAGDDDEREREANEAEIVEGLHERVAGRWSLVVGETLWTQSLRIIVRRRYGNDRLRANDHQLLADDRRLRTDD